MSNICPMCGAYMKTNVCEYCRYEIEEKKEKVQKEPKYEENNVYSEPNTVMQNEPIYGEGQYNFRFDTVSGKNKTVAFVLCLLLGFMGAHQFYVGKIGLGIFYLFTAGIFGIGWFCDLILIALGKFKDKDGLALK